MLAKKRCNVIAHGTAGVMALVVIIVVPASLAVFYFAAVLGG
jgi:hypothetical protein